MMPNITLHRLKYRIICSFLFCACLTSMFGIGCAPALKAGAPLIRDFAFTGQTGADPRRFCFSLEFQDEEGDLASTDAIGEIRITVQDLSKSDAVPQATSPIKVDPQQVPPGTSAGIFPSICLDLKEDTGNWPDRIKFTAQLIDSQGNESNKAWVIVKQKE